MTENEATELAFRNGYAQGYEDGKRDVENAIVHCEHCKHWKNEINGCTEDKRYCDIGFYMIHKDGFCSFGQKKEV